jgi:hypothetical protein
MISLYHLSLMILLILGANVVTDRIGIAVEAFQVASTTKPSSYSVDKNFGYFQRSICLHAAAKASKSRNINQLAANELWFPLQWLETVQEDDYDTIEEEEEAQRGMEEASLSLARGLIINRLRQRMEDGAYPTMDNNVSTDTIHPLALGRFVDLTFTSHGEKVLEGLFCTKMNAEILDSAADVTVKGAVMAIQSLLGVGTLVGSQGTPEQIERSLAHLIERKDRDEGDRDLEWWDAASTRRLKYNLNRAPGIQLLRELKRKQTPQGAFDLLVQLGAWTKHEDLNLLRSGFALRFSSDEEAAAEEVSALTREM